MKGELCIRVCICIQFKDFKQSLRCSDAFFLEAVYVFIVYLLLYALTAWSEHNIYSCILTSFQVEYKFECYICRTHTHTHNHLTAKVVDFNVNKIKQITRNMLWRKWLLIKGSLVTLFTWFIWKIYMRKKITVLTP